MSSNSYHDEHPEEIPEQVPVHGQPQEINNRGARRRPIPIVTTAIIVLCVALAIVDRLQPQVGVELLFYRPLAFDEEYRFVTSAFLHGGFWHLVFNMYALWLLGSILEPALGKIRFFVLYVLSAIGGNAAIVVLSNLTGAWNIAAVGASGAIFGLFGALLVVSRGFNRNSAGLFAVIAINLALGFVIPGISWESHIGGLLTGLALTYLWLTFARKFRGKNQASRLSADLGSVTLVLATIFLVQALTM